MWQDNKSQDNQPVYSPSSQMNEGMLEFFPLLVALALGKEEDETAHQLEELKTIVTDVLDHFKAEVRM